MATVSSPTARHIAPMYRKSCTRHLVIPSIVEDEGVPYRSLLRISAARRPAASVVRTRAGHVRV